MNANSHSHQRIIFWIEPALAAEWYLNGYTPKEISKIFLIADDRIIKALRLAGVWQVPMFKALHVAARKEKGSAIRHAGIGN